VHGSRRLDQHMKRQIVGTRLDQSLLGQLHIGHRLDLGHHDVRQAVRRLACNGGHVGLETGVIDRVHTHAHTGIGCSTQRQLGDQRGMLCLATHRGTVFAIEGHIKDAGSKLLRHFSLQLQAFAHPRVDTAVMVANRQLDASGLRTQQDVARMAH